MNIQTSLMAWYDMEEDYALGYDVHDSSGRGNHVPTRGSFIEPVNNYTFAPSNAYRITGLNGYGIRPYYGCYHKDREDAAGTIAYPDFRLAAGAFTIAAWHYLDENFTGLTSNIICIKFEEYALRIRPGTSTASLRRWHTTGTGAGSYDSVSSHASSLITPNAWHLIIGWYDPTAALLYIQVDNGTVNTAAATVTNRVSEWPFTLGHDLASGLAVNPTYPNATRTGTDNLAIWKRVLTSAERIWLYNSGAGRTWEDIVPSVAATECKAIECCTPVSSYVSSAATDSGAGSAFETECDEDATVSFDPPCGSSVIFPIYVSLTSNFATATIRYTTDGTDPDITSTTYTGPITVSSPATQIRARAYPVDCPVGDVWMCSWNQYDSEMIFQVYCTVFTDTVGAWDVWAANGNDDLYFWLEINAVANFDVTRFEVYQLTTTMDWTTGAAWSTDSPITPPLPWDQTATFAVYPLMFNEIGTGVLYTDYQTTFGTITAGNHQYIVTAEPITTLGGVYKMIMILSSGDRVYAYARYSECDVCPTPPCGTEPPPCPFPTLDGLTPGCEQITVDFTVTAPDRDYIVYMLEEGGSAFASVATGNGSGALQEVITGLNHGKRHWFYVSQELSEATYDHCPDWTYTIPDDSFTFKASTVTIAATPTLVTSGGATTVTVTSANIPTGGTVTITSVPVVAATPFVCTPNTTVGQAFTVTANTTFTVTVAGGCDNPTATVDVAVKVTGSCDTAWTQAHPFLLVSKTDINGVPRNPSQMWAPCFNANDPSQTCAPATSQNTEWDGHLKLDTSVTGCSFLPCCCYDTNYGAADIYLWNINFRQMGVTLCLEYADLFGGPAGQRWWVMSVACPAWELSPYSKTVWVGYKDYGSNPQGTYLRLTTETMCDTQTDSVEVNPDP